MSIFKKWAMMLALLLSAASVAAESDIIRYYGGLAKNYPLKIQKIFKQVRNVARGDIRAELKVVNGRPNDPFAVVALSEETIVLSKLVIQISYRDVSEKEGNARLAFIFGHELAHIANGDFLPQAFVGDQKARQKEIQADKEGFVYAAMAGYAVDQLLWEKEGNFFVTWQKETDEHWQADGVHPPAEKRAKDLYQRLKRLLGYLPYYQFGVRLTHFNRCDESIYFLKAFLRVFPSREVYNNLGICLLEKARKELGYSIDWLPSLLDVGTHLDDFKLPPVSKGKSRYAKQLLIEAKSYFEAAYERDPYYVPAKVNLAITAFFLGELEEARKAAPDESFFRVAVAKKTWKLPVELGTDTSELAQWEKNGEVSLHDLYEEFYRLPDGRVEVLGLGEVVAMVVLKTPDVTVNELPDYCGEPLRERQVVNGRLLSCYDWAALVVGDRVEEIWVGRPRLPDVNLKKEY